MAAKKAKRQSAPKKINAKFENCENLSGEEFHRLRRQALDYYHFEHKTSDLLPSLYAWMKDNEYSKDDIDAVKSQGSSGLTTAAILTKCLEIGMPDYLPQHDEYWQSLEGTSGPMVPITDSIKRFVEQAIKQGSITVKEKEQAEEEKAKAPVKTIQQRMLETAMEMCHPVDEIVDELHKDPENFDPKAHKIINKLKAQEVKPNHARIIKDFYQGEYDEFLEVQAGNDEQLNEGYRHISKKALKNMIAFYAEILGACEMLQQEAKVTRKPRAKKPVAKDKLVAKLKFMKSDDKLKLVSVDPTKILDATELWVYNTKTRKLGKYTVDDPYNTGQKLSVKGTSITNFNESNSVQKTLRKPEEKLAEFKSAGKVALRKFMDDINAVDIKLTGRINEDTILLKVT